MRTKMFFAKLTFIICIGSLLNGEGIGSSDHATVGMYVVRSSDSKTLIDKNSELSLVPSSCMKVVTTGAALHLLGPDYRFETQLQYDGTIDAEKTLHGNLYIIGGGDPCLGSDRIAGSLPWEQLLHVWTKAISDAGIKRIEGRVIGDATRWEKALAVPGWAWEDLGNYYGAGACALSFHENSYSVFFKPANEVGKEAPILRTDFPVPALRFYNEVKTGPEGSGDCACIYGSEFSSVQTIRGTVPAGVKEFSIKGAIPDPGLCCATLLKEKLLQEGMAVAGADLSLEGDKSVIYTTYSPTVAEIIFETNQKSINLYAEHLLKKMGEVVYKEGSTVAGVRAVTEFWRSKGVDLNGFHMTDGSGLCRKNLLTARQLVSMLIYLKKSDVFTPFFASLPEPEEGIRAKSGSMSLIKGFAGYRGDKVFAVLVNHCPEFSIRKNIVNDFFSSLKGIE